MKKYTVFMLVFLLTISAYSQQYSQDLLRLCNWMTGSFSSNQQSTVDTSYYDIRLHMEPVFTDRTDGCWFYVEQALASNQDRPYRQRVYHVYEGRQGTFTSDVYEIDQAIRYTGAWKNEELLHAITMDQLELKDGCSVNLRWNLATGTYEGGTAEKTCPSELNRAAYATSQVMVLAGRIVSWDRGFDEAGEQVGGAEKGPYQFVRVHD